MADLASLFPALLALVATAMATGGTRLLSGRAAGTLLWRYVGLMVPATATALALVHLHSDYGSHALPCLPAALLGAMAALSVACLAVFAYRQWQLVRHLDAWSVPAPPALAAPVRALAAQLGMAMPAVFLVALDRPVALTVGVLQPRIYLSAWYLQTLSPAELEAVIAHELAHIARRDNFFALLGALFLGATAYLPASWRTAQALLADRELATDALAVALTGKPLALARALAKASASDPLQCAPVASSVGGDVEARLQHLLLLSKSATPSAESLRRQTQHLLAATLAAPLGLGWLIFSLPHLLMLP